VFAILLNFFEVDIAIDDVMFVNCDSLPSNQCGLDMFACANGGCIQKVQQCNFVNDCEDESDEIDCPTYQ